MFNRSSNCCLDFCNIGSRKKVCKKYSSIFKLRFVNTEVIRDSTYISRIMSENLRVHMYEPHTELNITIKYQVGIRIFENTHLNK